VHRYGRPRTSHPRIALYRLLPDRVIDRKHDSRTKRPYRTFTIPPGLPVPAFAPFYSAPLFQRQNRKATGNHMIPVCALTLMLLASGGDAKRNGRVATPAAIRSRQ
jgi:hypothetical protein